MKAFVVFVFLAVLAGMAAADYGICWDNYVSCSEQCCESANGDYTVESDGVYCDSNNLHAYYLCDKTCVSQELSCISPGSSCVTAYNSCVQSCGGTDSCGCADDGFDCVDNEGSNNSSSGCCSGFIILLIGSGGLAILGLEKRDG